MKARVSDFSCVPMQALTDFLQQWRYGNIKNASAYLTNLLKRGSRGETHSEQDAITFMDIPLKAAAKVGFCVFQLKLSAAPSICTCAGAKSCPCFAVAQSSSTEGTHAACARRS